MKEISERFLRGIDKFAYYNEIPIISFENGQRKEDLAAKYLAQFTALEGVPFIGKAQEKVCTFRTEEWRNARSETYPWIIESSAMVNHFYFYAVDVDFRPFFLKYSSYFPYGGKLCFNAHEYLRRQLAKEKIAYEELALNQAWYMRWRCHIFGKSSKTPGDLGIMEVGKRLHYSKLRRLSSEFQSSQQTSAAQAQSSPPHRVGSWTQTGTSDDRRRQYPLRVGRSGPGTLHRRDRRHAADRPQDRTGRRH
jgi:hypothetical protein